MTSSNNHEHLDQLFRADFERIEVRYNPQHWKQLQAAMSNSAVESDLQGNRNSSKTKAKLLNLTIGQWLALGILLIALIWWLFVFNSPSAEKKPFQNHEQQPQQETISNTSSGHEGLSTQGSSKNSNRNALPPSILLDTILTQSESNTNDSLSKQTEDTSEKSLDNFIFW
jgi:cytoskeletal protein RodZ